MNRVLANPFALAVLGLVLLILASATFAVVPEYRQAVIVRFGQPQYIVNEYRGGEDFGRSGAGLIWRVPFIDRIVWVDKRVLDIDMDRQQVLSTDQLRLQVDAFARYRIVDPLRMVITAGTEQRVSDELRPILGSAIRNELGKRQFAALLSPERGAVMDNIQAGLNRVARQYGAEIVDVRIKRADLPEGSPLDSAFQRMRSAREQEARSIEAQGARDAQITRATADANAARVYADAFGKDADFYDFYRAMQSYERTFGTDGGEAPEGDTSIILSPDNAYLREFQGRGAR